MRLFPVSQLRLGLQKESGQPTVPVMMPLGLRMACLGLATLLMFAADSQQARESTNIAEPEPADTVDSSLTTAVGPDSTATRVVAEVTGGFHGVERWRISFESDAPAYNDVAGMAMDEVGNVFVAGWSWGTFREHSEFTYLDGVLLKLDPASKQVWRYLVATPFNDRALDIAATPDGGVYVVGTTYGALADSSARGIDEEIGEDQDYFVLKLDGNGEEVWAIQHGTSRGPDREGLIGPMGLSSIGEAMSS